MIAPAVKLLIRCLFPPLQNSESAEPPGLAAPGGGLIRFELRDIPVVYHGSDADVEVLEPRSLSGKTPLLYATNNLLIAVSIGLNKAVRNSGLTANCRRPFWGSVFTIRHPGGKTASFTFLSVNRALIDAGLLARIPSPFLFICSKADFHQSKTGQSVVEKLTYGQVLGGGEWITTETVKPLERISIHPLRDIPFPYSWHTDRDSKYMAMLLHRLRLVAR